MPLYSCTPWRCLEETCSLIFNSNRVKAFTDSIGIDVETKPRYTLSAFLMLKGDISSISDVIGGPGHAAGVDAVAVV